MLLTEISRTFSCYQVALFHVERYGGCQIRGKDFQIPKLLINAAVYVDYLVVA